MQNEFNIQLPPEMNGKSLEEIANYLRGRDLFPEYTKRMKELVAKTKWPKELLIEKK